MFCHMRTEKGVNLHCHQKEEVLLGCWSTACGCHVRQSCAGGDRFGRYQDVGLGGRRWEKGHKLDSNQVTIFLIALHGGSIVAVVTFEATVRATDSFNAWAIVDRGCYLLSGQERKLWIPELVSMSVQQTLMLLSSKIISGSTSTIILRKEWAAWYSVMLLEYKPH